MNINDRLRMVRKELGLTMEAMGEQISTSQGHISAMEKGTRALSGRTINLVCMRFNVRKDWLMTGTGKMFVEKSKDDEIAAFTENVLSQENDTFQKNVLTALSRLSTEEWELFQKAAKAIVNKNN